MRNDKNEKQFTTHDELTEFLLYTAPNGDVKVEIKFHFAITGKTAAEIIHASADKDKPFMGLKTWKNVPEGRILKSDTSITKHYMEEAKIKKLINKKGEDK